MGNSNNQCEGGLVKPGKLAKLLGVTSRTIRNWAESGTIPVAFVAGRTMRFNEALVLEELDRLTKAALATSRDQEGDPSPGSTDGPQSLISPASLQEAE